MVTLKGNVDRVDKMMIDGWALDLDDPEAIVSVSIIQGGSRLVTVRPTRRAPDIADKFGLKLKGVPKFRWRVAFPMVNGLQPEQPFRVVFDSTEEVLNNGAGLVLPLCHNTDPEAAGDLANEILFTPHYQFEGGVLSIKLVLDTPVGQPAPVVVANGVEHVSKPTKAVSPFGKNVFHTTVVIDPGNTPEVAKGITRIGLATQSGDNPRQIAHGKLRAVTVPPSLFDPTLRIAPLPERGNRMRISGPKATDLTYEIGGATTFMQLDTLAHQHFGRRITEFPSVVDWGCGCARVMRQFWELTPHADMTHDPNQQVLGVDIDEVNVEWSQQHMKGFGQFKLLDLKGFDEPDGSVDLLYGISVMTHLTEVNQQLWLDDIARIVKPGGCVLLSTHGEHTMYRRPDSIALPFFERFGFFDAMPDPAIGAHRETYYRSTFQSRDHVRTTWVRHFELLDVVAGANSFNQDFIVLRRR